LFADLADEVLENELLHFAPVFGVFQLGKIAAQFFSI
jgi:hypothetical protein